ncbi:T9SS type A sorting domain-containing protein [Halocola ammonii]
MKKLLLFTSLALFTLALQAQTFGFLNGEYEVYAAPEDDGADELVAHVDVKNLSDQELTVTVLREIMTDNVTGYDERFCWGGICYPNATPQSLNDEVMEPGEVIVSSGFQGFSGYYIYNGNEGLTTIKYCFQEVGNSSNEACFTIDYCVGDNCATLVGVDEQNGPAFELGALSPNPVRGLSTIQYDLGQTPTNASFVIYNMVGAKVKEVALDKRNGVVLLNAADFENGAYFYSLVVDGAVMTTKRMIVSK